MAKDGADLPAAQQVSGPAWIGMGPGETADFAFTPTIAGDLTMQVVTQVEGWVLDLPLHVR